MKPSTTTIETVIELAKEFLIIADALNERVSAYLNGSNDQIDIDAYHTVRNADKRFIDALNGYEGSNDYTYGLNYVIAECFID